MAALPADILVTSKGIREGLRGTARQTEATKPHATLPSKCLCMCYGERKSKGLKQKKKRGFAAFCKCKLDVALRHKFQTLRLIKNSWQLAPVHMH